MPTVIGLSRVSNQQLSSVASYSLVLRHLLWAPERLLLSVMLALTFVIQGYCVFPLRMIDNAFYNTLHVYFPQLEKQLLFPEKYNSLRLRFIKILSHAA